MYCESVQSLWADSEEDMDLFYDRIVNINFSNHYTSGVFIDEKRILTSFNPFRVLSRSSAEKANIEVLSIRKRSVLNGELVQYTADTNKVKKARQIVPLVENDINENLWHGKDKLHSPVHDLMIMLLDAPVSFIKETEVTKPENLFEPKNKELDHKPAGPLKSEVADEDTYLGTDIEYGGYGFSIYNEYLIVLKYNEGDIPIADCDEWLPKNWGHFICIYNLDDLEGVSSGAVLFSNKVVHGIGSFALSKGNRSILVFTDVKPYHKLIFNTFSDESERRSDASSASGTKILKKYRPREPLKRLDKKTKVTSW